MLRRSAQRLLGSLLPQLESSSSAASSLGSGGGGWEAVRGICSTACAQRKLFPPSAPVRPEGVAANFPREYLVDKVLSPELMCRAEAKRVQLRTVVREFERFPGDTGSTEVQVGLLTTKISDMAEHMRQHRKDYSSRKGLEAMLNQRRKLLQYLRRSRFDSYAVLISRLGLKDSYGASDRLSARYKPAVRTAGGASSSSSGRSGGGKRGGGARKRA